MFLFKAAISKKKIIWKNPNTPSVTWQANYPIIIIIKKKTQYNKHTCSAPTKQEKLLCKSKHIKTCSSNKTPKEQI